MKKRTLMILLVLLCIAGSALAQNTTLSDTVKLGVSTRVSGSANEAVKHIVEAAFIDAFTCSGRYVVVAEDANTQCPKISRMLFLEVASMGEYTCMLSARLMEVATAQIKASSTQVFDLTLDGIGKACRAAAAQLLENNNY